MYAPQLGRFLQRDPADFEMYEYGASTPTGAIDPFGLEAQIVRREIPAKEQHISTGFTDPRKWTIRVYCECMSGRFHVTTKSDLTIYVNLASIAEFEKRAQKANPQKDAAVVKATAEVQRGAVDQQESENAKLLKKAWDSAEKKYTSQISDLGVPSHNSTEDWEAKANAVLDKWVNDWASALWSRYAADRSRIQHIGGIAPPMPAESFEAYSKTLRERAGAVKCHSAPTIADNA